MITGEEIKNTMKKFKVKHYDFTLDPKSEDTTSINAVNIKDKGLLELINSATIERCCLSFDVAIHKDGVDEPTKEFFRNTIISSHNDIPVDGDITGELELHCVNMPQ